MNSGEKNITIGLIRESNFPLRSFSVFPCISFKVHISSSIYGGLKYSSSEGTVYLILEYLVTPEFLVNIWPLHISGQQREENLQGCAFDAEISSAWVAADMESLLLFPYFLRLNVINAATPYIKHLMAKLYCLCLVVNSSSVIAEGNINRNVSTVGVYRSEYELIIKKDKLELTKFIHFY